MMKKVVLFPGQGSQTVGMFEKMVEGIDEQTKQQVNRQITALSNVVNQNFESLVNTDEAQLNITMNTQPALYIHSIVLYQYMESLGFEADLYIGHSLGELTALAASQVYSLEDGVKITRQRGELMDNAYPKGVGSMAAILKMDDHKLLELIGLIDKENHRLSIANFNTPSQTVITGHYNAVEEFVSQCKEYGAKKAIQLNVSGPFHSPLMKTIEEPFKSYVQQLNTTNSMKPIIGNYSAKEEKVQERLIDHLVKQLYSPVRFVESIERAIELGATEFIEVGNQSVLTNLVKKIIKEKGYNKDAFKVISIQTIKEAKEYLDE